MTPPSQAVFGRDIYQELIRRHREDPMRGDGQKLSAEFEGNITNPGRKVFRFPAQSVGVRLKLIYDVVPRGPDYQIYVRDAVLTTEVPWNSDHFFYCKDPDDSKKFTLPPFPSVATLKDGWCQRKKESGDPHQDGREWCATGANDMDFTWDDFFLYGNPYPKPYANCSVFRSLKLYGYHFMPGNNGVNVRADIAYDLRFKFLWWHHPNKRNADFNINDYFTGGLILGGAYDLFRRLLASTRPDRDCSPALEGLFSLMSPAVEAPAAKK